MIIRDENYFTDKYELTRTHSEVLEAVKVVVTVCTWQPMVMMLTHGIKMP